MVESALLRDVERRIAEFSHLPVENGESFYLLRYKVGEKYVPHMDYFGGAVVPGVVSLLPRSRFIVENVLGKNGGGSGNRYVTVLTYLGAPDDGGETVFPAAHQPGLKVKPQIVRVFHPIDLALLLAH